MKLAAISDIHGNLAALDAVLADIARHQVDLTVNLGDIVSGPLQAAATAERLMALDLPTIRGNHERQLFGDVGAMGASDRAAHAQLQPRHWHWLAQLPTQLVVDGDVLLVHGSPGDDLAYLLEEVTPHGCRPAQAHEVAARAGQHPARLILCGHTHLQRSLRLADGRLIANPGSVGLPAYADARPFPHRMEAGSAHARYAIATRRGDVWSVTMHAVAYDWDTAATRADANARPDWAHALRTGFALP